MPEFLAYNSEPAWVSSGTPLTQLLYRDAGAAAIFYLQSMLYSSRHATPAPDGRWSSSWGATMLRVSEGVDLPPGVVPGTFGAEVYVVSTLSRLAALRTLPFSLPQPLLDAINAQAHRAYPYAAVVQARAS